MSELKGKELAQELFGELTTMLSMPAVVYNLANGNLRQIMSSTLKWPDSHGRPYSDVGLREERKVVIDKVEKLLEEATAKYSYKFLASDGGGEGGAEDCWGVFSWLGVLYKVYWKYYSYDGDNFDNCDQWIHVVEAKEKAVTIYE